MLPYTSNSEGLCSSDKWISSLITAAQFLRWVFWFDPYADPHGERSGWKQWKQEGQRALISEQKVLKTSKNVVFTVFLLFVISRSPVQVRPLAPETGENREIFAGFLFYLFAFPGGEFA